MSGFDPATGWTHFTPTKVARYARSVQGRSNEVDVRLSQLDLEYYWDAVGGLHAHCAEGRLWEILSGQPDTFPPSQVLAGTECEQEWISVTDLGAVTHPPLGTSTVLKLLRDEGLIARVHGNDVPTDAAKGLYQEREATSTGRFPSAPGAVQRRWSYRVLTRLRRRSSDNDANP
jgi:hypothetical protein